ncbi:hypothetical protein L6452_05873 [Arctium lappa]|uniref:Uncharacterized protein n=1 Tax=Arctium lappa TaxID=4217 RepID=A0ACB9EHA5_ARCLA|nr:hypothetical protein L6452_05873 [Arctium lappa]
MKLSELFLFLVGETLREKLKISGGERLRLDGLRSQIRFRLQKVRSALKQIPTNSISYSEFLTLCIDICTNHEQSLEFAKMLDQVGDVIVLGNVVFPHPDQLAKSMEKLILQSMAILNDPRKQQLEELERQKAFIDKKSLSQVRGELYCGLDFLIVVTSPTIRRLSFATLTYMGLTLTFPKSANYTFRGS